MLWKVERKERRFHIAAPVRIRGVDRNGERFELDAWTLNVSGSGACIHIAQDALDLPRRFHIVAEDYQFLADSDVVLVWEWREPARHVGVIVSREAAPVRWQVR